MKKPEIKNFNDYLSNRLTDKERNAIKKKAYKEFYKIWLKEWWKLAIIDKHYEN